MRPNTWGGSPDFETTVLDIPFNPQLRHEAADILIAAAVKAGLPKDYAKGKAASAFGDCSRCGSWTRRRRAICFVPEGQAALGVPATLTGIYHLSLCSMCMVATPEAEQREWVVARVREGVAKMMGAVGGHA